MITNKLNVRQVRNRQAFSGREAAAIQGSLVFPFARAQRA
jgi:hypothetical protein